MRDPIQVTFYREAINALTDAFDIARRRLKDAARKRRGD